MKSEISQKSESKSNFAKIYHGHKTSFSKANLTALIATVVDMSSLYGLVEWAGVFYVTATALGAFAGALTNFTLNRFWAFKGSRGSIHGQGFRYFMVSGISLGLVTGAVFCLTEFAHLRYLVSKIFAAIAIGWLWNYPMHRYYVFPRNNS